MAFLGGATGSTIRVETPLGKIYDLDEAFYLKLYAYIKKLEAKIDVMNDALYTIDLSAPRASGMVMDFREKILDDVSDLNWEAKRDAVFTHPVYQEITNIVDTRAWSFIDVIYGKKPEWPVYIPLHELMAPLPLVFETTTEMQPLATIGVVTPISQIPTEQMPDMPAVITVYDMQVQYTEEDLTRRLAAAILELDELESLVRIALAAQDPKEIAMNLDAIKAALNAFLPRLGADVKRSPKFNSKLNSLNALIDLAQARAAKLAGDGGINILPIAAAAVGAFLLFKGG